ncbi:vacuolar protein sorting-associated protein 17 [[Candida] jaroonii]|uniref:Vacuolar protein sorting-associated protein 17 n=1 Tax=[Candida] jaroonii TaxID=467808 RepID=A0ACA9YE73_9ASCO|nr:vacuolar protein sorting-associated protein 17 [[Candida] jaroonii]
MASSIPYDPDFEDNNPFSSQIQTPTHSIPALNNSIEDEAPEDDDNDETNDNDNQQSNKLTQEELRRLLPERFSHKFSMKITITSIEKNKPENPIIKFDASIENLPRFRQIRYKDIRRTYQEVVKFNKYLSVSNLECFVPPIPSSVTSYPNGGEDESKKLMINWQEWFDRICNNPIIIRDEEFVFFIENDFGYSVINSNKKTSVASGLVRKTLKQLAVPYDEYEDLSTFRPLIKNCYLTCSKLVKLLDKNSKNEKLLATTINEFSTRLQELSKIEIIHPGMKNMWEKLSKIKLIEADLLLIQSYNDMGILGDGLQYLSQEFYEIKESLTNRHLIMRELIQAQQNTQAKHLQANKIKSKSSLDPIKVDEAIRSLEYATKTEESLNLQIKRISGEMLIEKDEILDYTELKLHKLLKKFTLNKVENNRKILKHLETIRLDIRIIDEKGGLSRLNRENLSNLKHNLIQSQSNNGDSWSSRTFRSLNEEKETKEEVEIDFKDEDVDAKNAANLLGVATF